jgi:hypothetical protein
LSLVRSLCEGWAAGQASTPILTHCVDPDSGLPTGEYLGVRLGETYGVAERAGRRVGETHALLLTDVESHPLEPWSRIVRSAVVGQGLVLTFGEGHPMAALGGGVFAVLVERGSELGTTATVLRTALGEHARTMGVQDLIREPPRVWLEPLPDTRMQAVELLEHLRR